MKIVRLVTLLGLLLNSYAINAQPGDPGGGGNPTPITGIEILLGGGALLGIKKILARFKSDKK